MIANISFDKYKAAENEPFYKTQGKIANAVGLTLESYGPDSKLGDICTIYAKNGITPLALSEVVGFKDGKTLLMPYDHVEGVSIGCIVENEKHPLEVTVSDDLLGLTLNGIGVPDGGVEVKGKKYPIEANPPDPMKRKIIDEVLPLGVKAVDGLLTIGKGQRIGIFAGSGVGKSTLLGMFARNTKADINVIALIGERGREVREFVERDLGPEGMKRSVLVIATSDRPALERTKAAKTATAIAEYFRDQGKDVLLMMDSLTRYCMAEREIGLSIGEPPVARGYTPSIYASLPKLLERCGNFRTGSITGLFTVLVEGDDSNEPVSDTVRGIIDGHIMLSRKIAAKNHYPAIDVTSSLSRLMSEIASPEQKACASKIRKIMALYQDNADLISIGAYKSGTNPDLDDAIRRMGSINEFLQQPVDEKVDFQDTVAMMSQILE